MAVSDAIQWGSSTLTIAEGSSVDLSYSLGMGTFEVADVTALLDGYAIATAKTSSTVTFYGVTAGTITIPKNVPIGNNYVVNGTQLTITVTAVDDNQYLNRHGLGKFARAVKKDCQNTVTQQMSSAGYTRIVEVSTLPALGVDENAIYVVVP